MSLKEHLIAAALALAVVAASMAIGGDPASTGDPAPRTQEASTTVR